MWKPNALVASIVTPSLPGFAHFLAPIVLISAVSSASAEVPFLREGKAGFVVSDIRYVLARDAAGTAACPQGMSLNVSQVFASTVEGQRREGETDKDYAKRLEVGSRKMSTAPNGQNLCMNPEAGGPDPYFRTLNNPSGPAGLVAAPNRFSQVVGCTRSFQSTGPSNGFATEMLTGSWGILIELDQVQDIANDTKVGVRFFANADPIQLSADRKPLAYASYAFDHDPRYRASTSGRIKNGVLTTNPVDIRFHDIVNGMHFVRPLRHAILQATISANGSMTGYFAGYTPVEAMYDMQFGYRNGLTDSGRLAPLRLRLLTGNGAARVLGYTCPGAYQALYKYADGDRDPKTNRYTSISTQYQISAIPAFVVDIATQSANAKLSDEASMHEQ